MTAERWIGRVVRLVTGLATRNELFDLAKRSAARNGEPSALALWSCDTRELAPGGPRYGTSTQCFSKVRQRFKRFRYAESLFGPSRTVAEESFDVLGETAEAEMQMNIGPQSAKERAPFLAIEPCSFLSNPGELIVRSPPIEVFGAHSLSLACCFASPLAGTKRNNHQQIASRSLHVKRTLLAVVHER